MSYLAVYKISSVGHFLPKMFSTFVALIKSYNSKVSVQVLTGEMFFLILDVSMKAMK